MRFIVSFLTLALTALFAESTRAALDPSDLARNAREYKTKVKQNADLLEQIYNAAKSEPKSFPTTKQLGIGIGGDEMEEEEATFSPSDEYGYTYSFDPSVEDPNWPGAFPTEPGDDLMVNIQTDNFTSEIFVNMEFIFTTNSTDSASATTRSTKKGIPAPKQAGQSTLASVPFDTAAGTEAIYRIEVLDLGGDGIFTNGDGWVTITDRNKNILWSIVGDYTYVASAYLYLHSNRTFELIGSTHPLVGLSGGSETSTMDPTLTMNPTSTIIETVVQSPTASPVTTTNPPTDPPNLSPTNPPTKSPTRSPSASPTQKPTASPTQRPTSNPTQRPTSNPTQRPTGAPGGNCELCDGGDSVGNPFSTFEADDGSTITCSDIEDVYRFFTDQECAEFKDTGVTEFYQVYCECPGTTLPPASSSSCQLCPDGSYPNPSRVVYSSEGQFTCSEIAEVHESLDDATCQQWSDEGITNTFRQFCECPGFEAECFLCPGGMGDPNYVLTDDGTTCATLQLGYTQLDATECADMDAEGLTELFENFCEC